MNTETQTEKPQSRKIAKWIGIVTLSLIVLLLLLIVSIYFVLRQGSLTNTALNKINPVVNAFGVNISRLDSANIDLLGDIDIKGLAVQWQDEAAGNANLSAGQIRLRYSLSDLLSSKLIVPEVLLSDLELEANLKLAPTELPVEEKASTPLDLNSLGEILKQPPLPIDIQNVSLQSIRFAVQLSDAATNQILKGSVEKVQTHLLWNQNQLKIGSQLALNQNEKNPWKIILTESGKNTTLEFLPVWKTDVALELTNNNNLWQLPVFSISQDIYLQRVNLEESVDGKTVTQILTDNLAINLISSKNQENVSSNISNGLAAIFPMPIDTHLKYQLAPLSMKINQGKDLSFATNLKQHLSVNLHNVIDTITPLAISTEFKIEQLLEIPDLVMKLPEQTLDSNNNKVQLSASGKSNINSNQKIDLAATYILEYSSKHVAFSQAEKPFESPAIKAGFTPSVNLQGKLNLPDLSDVFSAVATLNASVAVQLLEASMKGNGINEDYALKQQNLDVALDYNNKQIQLQSTLALDKLKAPQLQKVVSLRNTLKVATNLDLDQADVDMNLDLDQQPLLNAKLTVDNRPNKLKLQHDITLNAPIQLSKLHEAADALKLIGSTNTHLTGNTILSHRGQNIQAADPAMAEQWPVNTVGKIKLVQTKAPTVTEGITITDNLSIEYDVNKDKQIKTDVSLSTPGIKTDPLLAAIPVEFRNKTQLTWPLSQTVTEGYLNIENIQALKYDLNVDDKPKYLQINGNIVAKETPQWQKYIAEIQAAEAVGMLTVKLSPNVRLKHNANTILEFDPEKLEAIVADVTLNAEISQSPDLPGKDVVLHKPLSIKQIVAWSTKELKSSTELNIGSVELPGQLKVENLPGKIQLQAKNGLEPEQVDLSIHFDRGDIVVYQTVEEQVKALTLSNLATPLSLDLIAQKQQETAIVENLKLELGNGVLEVNANGNAALDGKNAIFDINIVSTMQNNLLPEQGLSGSGKFSIPVKLVMVDGKQATLESSMAFNDFSLAIDTLKLEHINGKLNIYEELLLQDEFVGFKYLLQADPFQRVDFDRIQPYLDSDNVISFENIEMNGLKIGPGMTSINIQQNLVRVPRMDMEIFDGHIMGQLFFDATPGAQKFGLLSRISRIDPRYLLPESSKEKKAEAAPISTRTALTFDINERLMEGEVDVTQISKAQLLQLLELVDPEHKDEQIATVRSALRFAYPQRVSIDMMSGLMNLEIAISALPKPIKLRGLPLTPIIQQSAGDIEAVLSQLPLKNLSNDVRPQ